MYDTTYILLDIFPIIFNLYLLFKNELKFAEEKLEIFDSLFFWDIPKATISTESKVYFGFESQIRSKISSTLPPNKYIWQKSADGNAFHCIDINERKYYGTDHLKNRSLVLQNTTFDDILYFRLLVGNLIGVCVSNTVHLNVTGSMFSHVM